MKMALHIVIALTLSSSVQAGFLAVRGSKVQTDVDPVAPQPAPQAAAVAFAASHQEPVDHAAAAQASAARAQQHLQSAQEAYNKTKANVKEIHSTGKKIEDTAGKIKDLYGGSESDAESAKSKEDGKDKEKEAPEVGADGIETGLSEEDQRALEQYNREEAAKHRAIDVVAQIIFAILYWFLVVKHYPSFSQLGPPTQEAKELQSVDEVTATCHTSCSNLFLAWCCSGPRAAHTFYTTIGFNYWVGCCLTSMFPCCTLWYFNSFTDLNERLGGEKRSAFMGLICACCCSCCVIAQDAEALDMITGLQTNFCSVRRAK